MVTEADKSPLVSVILPFYNAPRLQIAIESILNQSFSDFELLLINNSSTDQSAEIAERFTRRDSRVKLLEEPRQGVVFATNTGINYAKGEYILRMDADDYSYPGRIELQLNEFETDPDLGVVSGLVEYQGDPFNEGFSKYVDWLNTIRTPEEISRNRFVEFPMANPSMMFRRKLFKEQGMYEDGLFPEDYELFLRFQENGIKMRKVNEPVLRWIDSETRLTRTDERYSQEAFFKIKAKYLVTWLESHNPFHPNILVWGAGRVSRRRSDYLKEYGISIEKYIDIKKGANTIHFEDIPVPEIAFIVSYVANRGAREEIRKFLIQKNYVEGIHFILAS